MKVSNPNLLLNSALIRRFSVIHIMVYQEKQAEMDMRGHEGNHWIRFVQLQVGIWSLIDLSHTNVWWSIPTDVPIFTQLHTCPLNMKKSLGEQSPVAFVSACFVCISDFFCVITTRNLE